MKGYKVKNAGSQEVKAPNQDKGKRTKPTVKKGKDLRAGK